MQTAGRLEASVSRRSHLQPQHYLLFWTFLKLLVPRPCGPWVPPNFPSLAKPEQGLGMGAGEWVHPAHLVDVHEGDCPSPAGSNRLEEGSQPPLPQMQHVPALHGAPCGHLSAAGTGVLEESTILLGRPFFILASTAHIFHRFFLMSIMFFVKINLLTYYNF